MEQAAFDDHEERVRNPGDCLQQLVLQDELARKEPTDPQQTGPQRRLVLIETELCDFIMDVFE